MFRFATGPTYCSNFYSTLLTHFGSSFSVTSTSQYFPEFGPWVFWSELNSVETVRSQRIKTSFHRKNILEVGEKIFCHRCSSKLLTSAFLEWGPLNNISFFMVIKCIGARSQVISWIIDQGCLKPRMSRAWCQSTAAIQAVETFHMLRLGSSYIEVYISWSIDL